MPINRLKRALRDGQLQIGLRNEEIAQAVVAAAVALLHPWLRHPGPPKLLARRGVRIRQDPLTLPVKYSTSRPGAMSRYVLTVDLRDDPAAIAAYRGYHRRVWPEVLESLRRAGVRGIDLDRVIVPRAASPVFVLERLTDFLLRNSAGLPD